MLLGSMPGLDHPGWVAWVRVSDVARPKTPSEPSTQYIHEIFIPPGPRNPCNLDFFFRCMFLRYLTLNLFTGDLQYCKYDVHQLIIPSVLHLIYKGTQ